VRDATGDPQIEQALIAGQKIKAIQIYRRATGAGLTEAKKAIEDRQQQLQLAGKLSAPQYTPQQRFALNVSLLLLVICLVILAILRTWNASHVHP
jgi:predicted lysophospholipase L1 biosynthesis ABC-type transport system permease subunit